MLPQMNRDTIIQKHQMHANETAKLITMMECMDYWQDNKRYFRAYKEKLLYHWLCRSIVQCIRNITLNPKRQVQVNHNQLLLDAFSVISLKF